MTRVLRHYSRRLLPVLLVTLLAVGPAQAEQGAYWGSPQAAGGRCCASLQEVRDHIDSIDRQIVALMAERGDYVHEAARFKANPAAVDDPARVERIISRVRELATAAHGSPDVVEAAYRAMIAAFTREEQAISARHSPPPP